MAFTKFNHFRLWQEGDSVTSGNAKPALIITSHGTRPLFANARGKHVTVPPGFNLYYYCSDGKALAASTVGETLQRGYFPGITNPIRPYNDSKVKEIVTSGQQTIDYDLFKSQDGKGFNRNPIENFDHIEKITQFADIITIRSMRKAGGSSEVPFSEVLKDLTDAGYTYEYVICFFCRCGDFDFGKDDINN